MTFNGRLPLMEEDLEISKIEYLSNHWLDRPQILNLSSGDQTKVNFFEIKITFNGRWPLMEEDLKIPKISATAGRIFLKFWPLT